MDYPVSLKNRDKAKEKRQSPLMHKQLFFSLLYNVYCHSLFYLSSLIRQFESQQSFPILAFQIKVISFLNYLRNALHFINHFRIIILTLTTCRRMRGFPWINSKHIRSTHWKLQWENLTAMIGDGLLLSVDEKVIMLRDIISMRRVNRSNIIWAVF